MRLRAAEAARNQHRYVLVIFAPHLQKKQDDLSATCPLTNNGCDKKKQFTTDINKLPKEMERDRLYSSRGHRKKKFFNKLTDSIQEGI